MLESIKTRLCLVAVAGVMFAGLSDAQTVSFRDGVETPFLGGTYSGTQDTVLVNNALNGFGQSAGSFNFGGRDHFQVGPFNNNSARNSLIRFDVTALSGNVGSVTAVTLRLTVPNTGSLSGGVDVEGMNTLELHRLTPANTGWVEGTSTGAEVDGVSTWDRRIQGTPQQWGSPGANLAGTDYFTPVLATQTFDGSTTPGSTLDFVFNDVSFMDDWMAGDNAGLILRASNFSMGPNRIGLASSEFPTISMRPELIVSFTPVPEPSCVLLLCVAGAGALALRGRVRIRR